MVWPAEPVQGSPVPEHSQSGDDHLVVVFDTLRLTIVDIGAVAMSGVSRWLKVVSSDGVGFPYRPRSNFDLIRLMNTYCVRRNVDRDAVRFLHHMKEIDEGGTQGSDIIT